MSVQNSRQMLPSQGSVIPTPSAMALPRPSDHDGVERAVRYRQDEHANAA